MRPVSVYLQWDTVTVSGIFRRYDQVVRLLSDKNVSFKSLKSAVGPYKGQ